MNEESISRTVLKAVNAMMKVFRSEVDRKTAYTYLLMLSLQVLRHAKGDEYVRGLLHGELANMDTPLPNDRANLLH